MYTPVLRNFLAVDIALLNEEPAPAPQPIRTLYHSLVSINLSFSKPWWRLLRQPWRICWRMGLIPLITQQPAPLPPPLQHPPATPLSYDPTTLISHRPLHSPISNSVFSIVPDTTTLLYPSFQPSTHCRCPMAPSPMATPHMAHPPVASPPSPTRRTLQLPRRVITQKSEWLEAWSQVVLGGLNLHASVFLVQINGDRQPLKGRTDLYT